ncbi:hypothetical protein [Rothia halotolerans]|uniref:PH-like domain-containing protein n=1 Tax=Rothia halotolerans TaxID=405770 RepID=UPI00101DA44A|nr:hypothetical protein [Rothia halotolerans]
MDSKLLTTAILVILALLVFWGLRRGWLARRGRQADLAPLPEVPEELDGAEAAFGPRVQYVSTTAAGDWLDRIAAQGLGMKANGRALVFPDGLIVAREGARDLWIPAGSIEVLRRESGMAGKFVEREGLVVVTWRLGDRLLDTGLRTRAAAEAAPLLEALREIAPEAADALPGTDRASAS